MKKLENKTITLKVDRYITETKQIVEEEISQTYMELIFSSCNRPSNPHGGYTWDDIEKISRIENYLKKSKDADFIEIEDADFDFIKSRILTNIWGTADRRLLDFKKDLENIK